MPSITRIHDEAELLAGLIDQTFQIIGHTSSISAVKVLVERGRNLLFI